MTAWHPQCMKWAEEAADGGDFLFRLHRQVARRLPPILCSTPELFSRTDSHRGVLSAGKRDRDPFRLVLNPCCGNGSEQSTIRSFEGIVADHKQHGPRGPFCRIMGMLMWDRSPSTHDQEFPNMSGRVLLLKKGWMTQAKDYFLQFTLFNWELEIIMKELTLKLSREEAIVFYDWLCRYNASENHSFEDQAEQRVLWNMECMLESVLMEPFSPNYREILATAREKIRDAEE